MQYFMAFGAGFISTLLFHQTALSLLHAAGLFPKPAFDMKPTAPLRIPAVISLALWGGLWGVALWLVIRDASELNYWLLALVLGAVFPSLVALFVVAPVKGMPVAAGGDPKVIGGALLLNGVWGLGVALLMRFIY